MPKNKDGKVEIKNALISVYDKTCINSLVELLDHFKINIFSTGGTYDFIKDLGYTVTNIEELTDYPSILNGRVKTLHPKIFGGILKTKSKSDIADTKKYNIPDFDLVAVDLYPFLDTVKNNDSHDEIIEKIDIGGISLIRAAAKNYNRVTCLSSKKEIKDFVSSNRPGISNFDKKLHTPLDERKTLAHIAFETSRRYDSHIEDYLIGIPVAKELRYGENPHQKAEFRGNLNKILNQISGKELSYNNLLDIDCAINLMSDIMRYYLSGGGVSNFAIIKHNNPCGFAKSDENVYEAFKRALAGDPQSAFGGILISSEEIDSEAASEIDKIFFEVLLAPSFSPKALKILKSKKKRILIEYKLPLHNFDNYNYPYYYDKSVRSCLNGILWQEVDTATPPSTFIYDHALSLNAKIKDLNTKYDFKGLINKNKSYKWEVVTKKQYIRDKKGKYLYWKDGKKYYKLMTAGSGYLAVIIAKHTKSNCIVLVSQSGQLIGSGMGQVSRIDALNQAIEKAKKFGFKSELSDCILASDAFFPFKDCVELAHANNIKNILQPGGSIRDNESIDFCDKHKMTMIFTGTRHFRH